MQQSFGIESRFESHPNSREFCRESNKVAGKHYIFLKFEKNVFNVIMENLTQSDRAIKYIKTYMKAGKTIC